MKGARLLIGVLIGPVILALLLWIGGLILEPYLEKKILNQKISGYQFDSVEVSVNLFTLSIALNNVLIKGSDSAETRLYIEKFKASGINPFKLVNGNVSARSIAILGIDAFLKPVQSDTLRQASDLSSTKFSLSTGHLSIEVDRFLWMDGSARKPDTLYYAEASLSGSKLSWAPEAIKSGIPFLYNQINLTVPYAQMAVFDSLYCMHIYQLELDTKDSGINIDLIHFTTNYGRYEIGEVTGLQRDWLDLSFEKLILLPVDFNKITSDTSLVAGALHIESFKARVFKDCRRIFPDKPDTKLPDALLRSLPVGLSLDSLILHTGDVEYAERAEGSFSEGKVTFKQLQAKIYNVGNRVDFLKAPTLMQASAMFMDKGYLNASFDIPNPAYEVTYKTTGALHAMPLKSLNSILPQSAGAEIASGDLKRLDFNFVYNNDVSDGELAFQYQDLKINLIDKSDNSEKNFLSALVNVLVVPRDNLAEDKNFKQGEIHTERDKKKAIFNFWWKSLFSGFKSTIL